MHWKYAANAGFFGGRRDRFTQYRPDCSLEEKVRRASTVSSLSGIELKFPVDFAKPEDTFAIVEDAGLEISAVNVDLKDARWFRHGALSAASEESRTRCVSLIREAMDIAASCGCGLVTTCPVMDGHDYAFEKDHLDAWDRLVESVGTGASHRDDVSLLLEYQPKDPLAHTMIGNVGAVIEVCLSAGRANLGANLDVGHAFAAGESPGESAARLSRHGLLRYVHANDNPGDGGDWDMISGTGHLFDWIELAWTLKRVGYDGWISADIAPRAFEAPEAYAANAELIEAVTDAAVSMHGINDRPVAERVPEVVRFVAERLSGGRK